MKKATLVSLAVVILLAIAIPVFAQEFPDVPADSWAYQAVRELASLGVVSGYPDGTFGGKRAVTRYELAAALTRLIPAITKMCQGGSGVAGACGPCGPQGPAGPAGPAGITPEQLQKLQCVITELQDELAALGVDVQAFKKDVAALTERVCALEKEQERVKWNAEANLVARGEVVNAGPAFDIDNRLLGQLNPTNQANVLANSAFMNDIELGVKGKVSKDTSVTALIAAGDYLTSTLGAPVVTNQFTLWNLYAQAGVNFGFMGQTDLVVGRFPFQVSPYTLKFVDPDSYAYVPKVADGDYVLDGARATCNISKIPLTLFAAKTGAIQGTNLSLPALQVSGVNTAAGIPVSQMVGARAVVGTPCQGNLGLTWIQMGAQSGITEGRANIYGGDLNATISGIGLVANVAKSVPSDALSAVVPDNGNIAWDAKLSYSFGKLGVAGGYTNVDSNYFAPGNWSRAGRAVNLQNVKGAVAGLNYTFGNNLSFVAEGNFLQPVNTGAIITARAANYQGTGVRAAGVDTLNYWRAGVKYALTTANTVDLGWEEVQWAPVAGIDTTEAYYSIGLGHTFNANSSLKFLYQIIDYKAGAIAPYTTFAAANTNYRGGVATAQFQLRY